MTPTDPIWELIAYSLLGSFALMLYLAWAWEASGWMTDKYIEWKLRRHHKEILKGGGNG